MNSDCLSQPSTRSLQRYFRTVRFPGSWFDGFKGRYRARSTPFDELLGFARGGESIADVGCGNGQFLLLLGLHRAPRALYGCEVVERLVRDGNDVLSGHYDGPAPWNVELYDGIGLPPSVAQADLVYSTDVLHHIPVGQQHAWVKALCAAVRPGARLILTDVDALHPFAEINRVHDLLISRDLVHPWDPEHAAAFAEKQGMTVLSMRRDVRFWYPHFTLELLKNGSADARRARASGTQYDQMRDRLQKVWEGRQRVDSTR